MTQALVLIDLRNDDSSGGCMELAGAGTAVGQVAGLAALDGSFASVRPAAELAAEAWSAARPGRARRAPHPLIASVRGSLPCTHQPSPIASRSLFSSTT